MRDSCFHPSNEFNRPAILRRSCDDRIIVLLITRLLDYQTALTR
jgi:hypothetical protein